MPQLLPPLFIALAGLALVVVLVALWSSLRLLFAGASSGVELRVEAARDRKALLEEKHALLQSIRDLELERDLGKLSPRDHERLDAQTRSRAREVLRALDEQVEPFRARAEALVADALADVGDASATDEAATPATDAKDASVTCAACSTHNDADAVFCKKCGTRLREAEDDA